MWAKAKINWWHCEIGLPPIRDSPGQSRFSIPCPGFSTDETWTQYLSITVASPDIWTPERPWVSCKWRQAHWCLKTLLRVLCWDWEGRKIGHTLTSFYQQRASPPTSSASVSIMETCPFSYIWRWVEMPEWPLVAAGSMVSVYPLFLPYSNSTPMNNLNPFCRAS